MSTFSLMYQSVNSFWKVAVQHVGCVFAYFYGGHKNVFGYDFETLLNKTFE